MTRPVFFDEHGNEMTLYVNDKGLLFLQVSDGDDFDYLGKKYIVLDKEDVKKLHDEICRCIEDMEE